MAGRIGRGEAVRNPFVARIGDAIRDGKTFARIVREQPDVVKARGPAGWTALMYAAAFGRPSDVRELLDKDADPNVERSWMPARNQTCDRARGGPP